MSAISIAAQAPAGVPLRAVDYLRVSTAEQAKGYGIAYTGRRTAAYVAGKGWTHVGTFVDEAASGTRPWKLRDGAARLMELAVREPRPFDLVCVYETRAIGRQKRVFWEWVWSLQDLGVFVAVVDQDIDNTTEAGESRMRDEAEDAFKELAKIRERVQGGIQEKAEAGGFPGGQARYGYRIANQGIKGEQRLVLDVCDGGEACTRTDPCEAVHEADVLREARRAAVRLKRNWEKVALHLNAEGLFTRSGKPWSGPNIRGRLTDEDLLSARFVFRSGKNGAQIGPDGLPLWGASVTLHVPPMFTPDEVSELRGAKGRTFRRNPVRRRAYPLSTRLLSPCGHHYVGSSPHENESVHYVCNGKRPEYAGAATCSCSQIFAQGVEEWVWGHVCALFGGGTGLVSTGAASKVDYSARLASLDQKIAEQYDIIRGLLGGLPETVAESSLRPLFAELEQLRGERDEIALWRSEAQEAEQGAEVRQDAVLSAHGCLEHFTKEQQGEWLGLLGITVRVLENPPAMRRGLGCPIGEWFRERGRDVPALSDEVWRRIAEAEGFAHGGLVPRQAGGPAPRTVLEVFLAKAITGASWPVLEAEAGFKGLIGHWNRWSRQGRWERVMEIMKHSDGAPPAPRHRLPKMRMTGEVRPGVVLAESGD
ncbi:recombinase family protein [Streptomyces sp. NPDC013181]|uniref:recombinase family protein n=1 Tax=unclassified Streptomyces TaxID=2593676 RepID=UPI0036A5276B